MSLKFQYSTFSLSKDNEWYSSMWIITDGLFSSAGGDGFTLYACTLLFFVIMQYFVYR